MKLTIHRGTHEIGGSCVELQAQGKSLILDIGLPLVNADGSPFDEERSRRSIEELVADGLLPPISGLYGDGPCDVVGVVLSHAHQDHYGLGRHVRADIPVYASEGTEALISVSKIFLRNPADIQNLVIMPPRWEPFQVGPFKVTTHPVDHSAPDAIALMVEADGRKVFYSGDLRGHGRKAALFEHMIKHPPRDVDVLLMEGSTIGRAKSDYPDETSVEKALAEVIAEKDNLALVFCSSQNLDRLVTIFRAAKQTDKILVIDLYTAYVLHSLKGLSKNIPQYDWEGVRVKFWGYQKAALEKAGHKDFVYAMMRSRQGIKTEKIVDRCKDAVMLAKANRLFPKFIKKLPAYDGLKMIWSMWDGYLKDDVVVSPFCAEHGLELNKIHASGHATVEDLLRLAQAIQPKRLVPIHTFHPDQYQQFGVPVIMLKDGEVLTL